MKRHFALIVVGMVLVCGAEGAAASKVEGTFTGTVYGAGGVTPGGSTNLSGLIGSTITGSFSYDSQSLTLTSSGPIASTWDTSCARTPVVMSVTVGGQSYTMASGSSYLNVDADESGSSNPANRFNLAVYGSRIVGIRSR